MPKVYNKAKDKDIPADAIYIGRPSLYGNPFIIGKHGNRARVVDRYKFEVLGEMSEREVEFLKLTLRGKDLVCWCAPLPCHGDILLKLAND